MTKKACMFCRRGPLKATSRSHSNIGTLRRQYINLQPRWFEGFRVQVCTKCIKTAKRTERIAAAGVVTQK